MQILVRHGLVIDYCDDGYVCTGTSVVCESKGCNFEDCSIVDVEAVPTDIYYYDYYYEDGKFIKGLPSGKSTTAVTTLLATEWLGSSAPYTYVLTMDGVTATSNQEVLPTTDITQEQLEALQGANITDGGQTANTITLLAWGDMPGIDIPIRVIKRGDM